MIQFQEADAPVPSAALDVGADFRRPRDDTDSMKVGSLAGKEWIERRAKLFEAGSFPDKGVRVSMEDLAALAAGFKGPVPVLIEHSDSALQMGFLTRVEALGDELFGTVALTKEANELLEASGAKSLSLGLSQDLTEIREVSIVRNPRVADAELYSGFCFCGELEDCEELCVKSDGLSSQAEQEEHHTSLIIHHNNFESRFETLKREVQRDAALRTVEGFVREGRICPAQAPFAEAMLQAEDVIEFDGESRPIRQLLIAMIERQPPMAIYSAAVPESVSVDSGATKLLPEEAEFYRKHFPDVSLEEIAARKGS